MKLFFVRVNILEPYGPLNRADGTPRNAIWRVVPIEGHSRGETGGEAVRTFCSIMRIANHVGFSFEEIKEK